MPSLQDVGPQWRYCLANQGPGPNPILVMSNPKDPFAASLGVTVSLKKMASRHLFAPVAVLVDSRFRDLPGCCTQLHATVGTLDL